MDQETLTNHISKFGKVYFEKVCKIVLRDVFNLNAINVDGKNDGGTDFASFNGDAKRMPVAFQITTQKTDIERKAYKDAVKSIKKLGVNRFYFLTTFVLSETQARKIENQITNELNIQSICLSSNLIAGMILAENLLNKFLDETDYPLPREFITSSIDYREMALHSYTLLSEDASNLKDGIYDDTILFILSNDENQEEKELIIKVKAFLGLNDLKDEILQRRINILFGREQLKRSSTGNVDLSDKSKSDIEARKKIYESEMSNLVSAQTDLLRRDYDTDWTIEDSKKVAVWIAEASIANQISILKDIKANIVTHPLFKVDNDSIGKIKSYLQAQKKVGEEKVDELIEELLEMASNHPLITKISRATIYLALEGSNPISSAKSLGAKRWSDFNIMIEPTVAIPYTCSRLYNQGYVNKYFDLSVRSLRRALNLDAQLYIPYFYINECAGHLLRARKYDGIELDEEELQFSNNAFVANYYALKRQGIKLPNNFMDYLATFSTAIKTERGNIKEWIRALMTDIQSILNKGGIQFIQVPKYSHENCAVFEAEYLNTIPMHKIDRPKHLIDHDIWALQFTNDQIVKNNEHWIILTYDKSLISFSKTDLYKGWVTNPIKFMDLTENTKPLSETKFVSLIHSVATYSERTLSAGARVMDKIISYASNQMQDWQFKKDIEQFKRDIIGSVNLTSPDFTDEIDEKIASFLKSKGIDLSATSDEEVDV